MRRSLILALMVFAACSSTVQAPRTSGVVLTPESLGAIQLSKREAFPELQRNAVDAVSTWLIQSRESPADFYAVVERPYQNLLLFHLWHSAAFLPEHRGTLGNPGGKCRDVEYDLTTGNVTRSTTWQ